MAFTLTIPTPKIRLPKPHAPRVHVTKPRGVVHAAKRTFHNTVKYGALVPSAVVLVAFANAQAHLHLTSPEQQGFAALVAIAAAGIVNMTNVQSFVGELKSYEPAVAAVVPAVEAADPALTPVIATVEAAVDPSQVPTVHAL
jgi:hypothetical protein